MKRKINEKFIQSHCKKKEYMGYLTDPQTFDPTDNQYDPAVEVSNTLQKRRKKECYYSDIVGDYIVDAITGEKYPWRVGTLNERRFFKVTDTTITVNYTRKGNYNSYEGRSSHKAYYENPHAYMRYKMIELDEEFVNEWYNKMDKLYPGEYTQEV